ncbi:MAG: TIM barrel protein [Planctomycetota bacterium]|jgi:phosphoglucan,water dikinase|nr:TIM barrel protein [Planctomycetota bacterium]
MEIAIGNQTTKYCADELAPFAYALQHDFSAFEWFADDGDGRGWTFSHCLPPQRAFLKEMSGAGKIRFSVHARWDADPRVAAGALALHDACQFAEEIAAPVVVAHLCPEINDIPAFVAAIAPLAQNYPAVALAVENTPQHSPAHFQKFFSELEKHPRGAALGMTLDLGHANCNPYTRNDYMRFLNELPANARIFHVHAHENWGEIDSHLTLFTGPSAKDDHGIKLAVQFLAQKNFSGSVILEQFPQPPDQLDRAFVRLKNFFRERATVRDAHNDATTFTAYVNAVGSRQSAVDSEQSAVGSAENSRVSAAPSSALSASTTTSSASDNNNDETPTPPAAPREEISAPVNNAPTSGATASGASASGASERKVIAALPESDFLRAIVAAMGRHTSWRTRLQWVRDTLCGDAKPTVEKLALLAALLRYLATGALKCAEDGGHYRPNHHAQAGIEIEDALDALDAPAWLKRRIYPFLPSHAAAFAVKEPLTRIRDIAHRNDIPAEMKQRIKHNLQNKLHRSAGPEDLQTAQEILAAITAPDADYAASFVNEFKVFFGELRDFFNVPDLSAHLRAAAQKVPALASAAAEFYHDARPALAQAVAAAALREQLADALKRVEKADRQTLRMADFDLENLVFARLSEFFNHATALSADWFGAARAAIVNAALSEDDQPDLQCVAAEIEAWRKNFDAGQPLAAARLLATLNRLLRSCATAQEKLYATFLPAATALGRALNIDDHAIATFTEGALRAGVLFQPAKAAELALPHLREILHLPAWEIIAAGAATGKLRAAKTLAAIPLNNEDVIARLDFAEGDEEIPRHIRGVILAAPLPQLSHLAIRARQQGVPFITAEDAGVFARLTALDGKTVALSATGQGVTVKEAAPAAAVKETAVVAAAPAKIEWARDLRLLTAAEITRENSGAKAANCARLQTAVKKISGVAAPATFAIPFGVMENCLRDAGTLTEYRHLSQSLAMLGEKEIEARLPVLREIILDLPDLPDAVFVPLLEQFSEDTRFAVRSSSNGEDLKELAGAGLYDSVIGVKGEDLPATVRRVWASLWTKRAALSRHYAGIPHAAVAMAALIQETLIPDYCFILHSADPVSGERGKVSVELAVGLGETLASARQPGRPYRLTVRSGEPQLWSCADYSFALRVAEDSALRRELVNYAQVALSAKDGKLLTLAQKLGEVALTVEAEFGEPQDLEGVVAGHKIYLVQARPQTITN